MSSLPAEWVSLCAVALALGARHGFDADHLAAIDGLTRHNARHGRGFARFCGVLFSAGHGLVVASVAVGVALARQRWEAPAWLQAEGAWLSIGFLTLIGILNLRAVLSAAPGEIVAPAGIRGRFLGGLSRAGHPALVALVGALFALSFDTISQSMLFAVSAARFGGAWHAAALAALFAGGMIVTDAINGLWISRLIARADRTAAIASRVMGGAVSATSLLVAAFGVARLVTPALDAWSQERDALFGALVVGFLACSYLVARALAVRSAAPAEAGTPHPQRA